MWGCAVAERIETIAGLKRYITAQRKHMTRLESQYRAEGKHTEANFYYGHLCALNEIVYRTHYLKAKVSCVPCMKERKGAGK